MTDKRELILVRLLEIAGSIEGVTFAGRNKTKLTDLIRPAIVIFDADETSDDRAKDRGRPSHGPNLVGMNPEILLLVGGTPEEVGATLNGYRVKLVKAVLNDATLKQLTVNGDIVYEGCATALAIGRSMEGEMGISFTFTYFLKPSEL